MEIYLIRHTTPLLTPGLIYGRLEVGLTEDFEAECAQIRSQIPAQFDRVFSSPAARCTRLAANINPVFVQDTRLTELDFGDWEGKTWDTVNQQDLQDWMDDFVNQCVPGGESMMQMQARVNDFWEELIWSDFERVAVVTHAGVIRLLLSIYRKSPLHECFNIQVKYGGIFTISLL